MRTPILLRTTLTCLAFQACHSVSVVHVSDTRGNPIQGAVIHTMPASMDSPEIRTDGDGFAEVPESIPPVDWVQVSKEGYLESDQKTLTVENPLRVTLEPLEP
ncbi:carboxypeptidase-like regulatory domain-containing protein [Haloferula chungangensis]|uniref:Carboxypeptidase-like regulatory domain-containing protein n=1 Tax=Haloferula chungangensis TaxID=1048331 RepID=A0ABW2L799_9BACT